PTHSWSQYLYRYPQMAFPYAELREENARRGFEDHEYELADTGAFEEDRFFDVVVTHAKASPTDICIEITATNQGPEAAPLDLLPQLTFRNTWAWGRDPRVPTLEHVPNVRVGRTSGVTIRAQHEALGTYVLSAEGTPEVLACDNETNSEALYGTEAASSYPKDAFNRYVVGDEEDACNPEELGTRMGLLYRFDSVEPGETVTVRLRLAADTASHAPLGRSFNETLKDRRAEADEFYSHVIPPTTAERTHVARRAFAGLMWNKQVYRYDVSQWLEGDPGSSTTPVPGRAGERNARWEHLSLADVISMPDEWEYPWFATWDTAFHCVAFAHVDPAFAKEQIVLMCREWAQNPDGAFAAYEWNFDDVNPPTIAWAAWEVYLIDGAWDRRFLVRVLTKLVMNYSWWINRKDPDGSNLFEGGFLGMDNIGLFDRSEGLPDGKRLEQADATAWVAFLSGVMLRMALELAREDPAWDDLASTFLQRFFSIAEAMEVGGPSGGDAVIPWDEEDGFFYDMIVAGDSRRLLKVRSMVGLLPFMAIAPIPAWVSRELTDYMSRLRWLDEHKPDQLTALAREVTPDGLEMVLTLVGPERAQRLLARMLDPSEFLAPHGIRSLSAAYREPVCARVGEEELWIGYVPGESTTAMFGGNSNWRGPVWIPVNALLLDAMREYAGAFEEMTVEYPVGSGSQVPLIEVADELEERLVSLFLPGEDGRRPGTPREIPSGPLWDEHVTFAEYFDGDDGRGLGATHQTGWTGYVAHWICSHRAPEPPEDSER
ncbi:MAG: glucosidase, partial [bacterium]|nr:glucosidase [bacterium]